MRNTQKMSLSLPNEMASGVKSKVARGEYASESDVVREGLRALEAHNRASGKLAMREGGSGL